MHSNDATDPELRASTLDFPVIGIGASAGGHVAIARFFEAMPADSGMAFVVLMHLSPDHASCLPQMLQPSTGMTVVSPLEWTPVEPNHVYVIPPNKLLSMDNNHLRLNEMDREGGRQTAIDLFFRSLAIVHGKRAVAIVLSGSGTDGAAGITRIKEEGGMTLAQTPEDAEFDGMPRAAIASNTVDWVMPVADMPAKLLDVWRNAQSIELPPSEPAAPSLAPQADRQISAAESEAALHNILNLLYGRTGHDFRKYRRATVLRRLERRLQVHGLPTLAAYYTYMQSRAEEPQALLKDLLFGVTYFLRDNDCFESLRDSVIEPLLGRSPQPEELRIWVPGCATGEEAYSIAMLLSDAMRANPRPPSVQVFATDIDDAAIAVARTAVYPEAIEADVPDALLRRHFNREGHHYRLRKEVREKVMFATHNLLRDSPFSRLDLISCRNLLSDLGRDAHDDVLQMFHFALNPGGYLFLGNLETVDSQSTLFSAVDKKRRIFKANPLVRRFRVLPIKPIGVDPMPAAKVAASSLPLPPHSYAELHKGLAENHLSPSVLVDAQSNIVHVSEHAGRFLRYAAGVPTHHLPSLVQPGLRLELRTTILQALRTGRSVEARNVQIEMGDQSRYVNMIARPVQDPDIPGRLVLVVFEEVAASVAEQLRGPPAHGTDPATAQLEAEIHRLKLQLDSTVEHAETTTEELKASNEKLQTINEELRAATEELKTSKEEEQAINEELIAVNFELRSKVEEADKINDDLQNLVTSTDIATVFVDREMNIKRYTPQATRLFNLIPTDVGRPLMHITDRLHYEQLESDAYESFRSLRVIEREVAGEGNSRYLVRVLPYRTAGDRIDGAVLTFVDITSRRKNDDAMRLIVESTRDYAIISFDVNGIMETWNIGAERIFGYADVEAIGRPSGMLFVAEDRQRGVPELELRTARESGRAEDDRWHLRKDGSRFFATGIMIPLYADGILRGFGKIARDVTGTKRFGEEREALLMREAAARAEAQAAIELKDEFLAVLSHELKNPLNLIQLNADLLARNPDAKALPAVLQAAQTISRTVASQAQIIDDLLDLSRVNTGKLALRRSAVDLAATVGSIATALGDDADEKQIDLRIESDGLPIVVDADPVRVEQIVWNLVSNALKFTPVGGHVTLSLSVDAGFGKFEVIDTGKGITADFLPHVFEMFKQAEATFVRRQGGMGIGLALVKHLADVHGGRVEAASAGRDRGASFAVWLPLRDPHASGHDDEPTPIDRSLAGRRVLLVDDERDGLQSLGRLLEQEGMKTQTASDADEAMALVREGATFDIVISDIAMPGRDGYMLFEQLKSHPGTANTPVVALTGFGRHVDVQRALDAGFVAHLGKPVSLDRLLETLHRFV